MQTECNTDRFDFQPLQKREVLGICDGGAITADAGALLLRESEATGKPARRFKDFRYRTRESWSRERRVVGKAEHLAKGSNLRFVVTSLSKKEYEGRC